MARFYFHQRSETMRINDPEGREVISGAAELREEALEDARELIACAARRGVDVTGRRFEIEDDRGRPVLTVPFAEALTPERCGLRAPARR